VLRKSLLKEGIELDYVSAPHKVPPIGEGADLDPETCLGWWCGQHWGSTKEIEARMFGESMDFLLDHMRGVEAYDGVLGFSQGAAMAALLVAHLQTNPEPGLTNPRFGVFISGFDMTNADTFQPLMNQAGRIELEGSLHISGVRDTLVIPERTKAMMDKFFDPELAQWHPHSGGHVVPSSSGDRRLILDFIKRFEPGGRGMKGWQEEGVPVQTTESFSSAVSEQGRVE
jgi:hypothetical protein